MANLDYPLPDGWTCLPLGDKKVCIEIRSGFACGKKETKGGVPHLRMNNIGPDGRADFALVRRVPCEVAEKVGRWLENGDVLFCNTNSTELVGKSCVFPGWQERCTFSNHLTRLRANKEHVLPEWLFVTLQHFWISRYFATNCHEFIGQSAFNQDELRELPIPLPPLLVQRRLISRVGELTSRVEQLRHVQHAIEVAIGTFTPALLAKAFRGEL